MKKRTRKPTKLDSCKGKKRMLEFEAREMAQFRKDNGAINVQAYECRFCNHWHTGSRKKIK